MKCQSAHDLKGTWTGVYQNSIIDYMYIIVNKH